MVCFAAAPGKLHERDLHYMDVICRKLLCSVVGAPAGLDLSCSWHGILHAWNEQVRQHGALLCRILVALVFRHANGQAHEGIIDQTLGCMETVSRQQCLVCLKK